MLNACMGSLMELVERDPRILYLTADSGEGGLDLMFRRNFPDRCFDFGIAEQNMTGAAAGLAASGKIPFIYVPTPFLVYRAFEFLRNDICLQNYPVKIIGTGSGLSVSSLGPTHHSTEDLGSLRSLPNLRILSPATPLQAWACIENAYSVKGPVFIRVETTQPSEYYSEGYSLPTAGFDLLREGAKGLILSTGSILTETMKTAEILGNDGINLSVANISILKPVNVSMLLPLLVRSNLVFTVEEHNIIGGLGSLIAEIIATERLNIQLIRIGLNDKFSVGYGITGRKERTDVIASLYYWKTMI